MQPLKNRRRELAASRSRLVGVLLAWPRQTKRLLMLLADVVVVPAALWAAFALKFDSLSKGFEQNLLFYVGVAATGTLIFAGSGLYRAVVRFIGARVLASILAGVTGSAVIFWFLSAALPFIQPIPISVAAIYWLIALVWITGSRLIARWLLTPFDIDGTRVVIYGAGDAGVRLALALAPGRQFFLLAYVDEKRSLQGTLMNGVPVIAPSELARIRRSLRSRAHPARDTVRVAPAQGRNPAKTRTPQYPRAVGSGFQRCRERQLPRRRPARNRHR